MAVSLVRRRLGYGGEVGSTKYERMCVWKLTGQPDMGRGGGGVQNIKKLRKLLTLEIKLRISFIVDKAQRLCWHTALNITMALGPNTHIHTEYNIIILTSWTG
jgi:hypothetical protein